MKVVLVVAMLALLAAPVLSARYSAALEEHEKLKAEAKELRKQSFTDEASGYLKKAVRPFAGKADPFDTYETDLVQVGESSDGSALTCKTVSTRGPSCWGYATVYCPKGWIMTGGGMQSNYGAFERSHPYYNGWMCDNRHGCGSGSCFVRCCQLPGFVRPAGEEPSTPSN